MNDLEMAREEINAVDLEMARLFERRMEACARIAAYKKEHGLPVRDPAREEALLARNRKEIRNAEIEGYYLPFLKQTVALSCEYQEALIGSENADGNKGEAL